MELQGCADRHNRTNSTFKRHDGLGKTRQLTIRVIIDVNGESDSHQPYRRVNAEGRDSRTIVLPCLVWKRLKDAREF